MGEVIAVVSGKGGTGKSAVCAGIATALAQDGKAVLCIDCDAMLRNLDIFLGIGELDALSFADVLSGNYGLNQSLQHPNLESLRFLTAPMSWQWLDKDEKAFEKMLVKAKKKFDYIFLDVPSGLGKGYQTAARYADRLVLVTVSDPGAIRGVSQAAQELEKMGKKDMLLVVNRVDRKMLTQMKLTIDDIMDEIGVALLGLVPEDSNVLLAAAGKTPLLMKTKKGAAAACRRIAKRLQGESQPIGI